MQKNDEILSLISQEVEEVLRCAEEVGHSLNGITFPLFYRERVHERITEFERLVRLLSLLSMQAEKALQSISSPLSVDEKDFLKQLPTKEEYERSCTINPVEFP